MEGTSKMRSSLFYTLNFIFIALGIVLFPFIAVFRLIHRTWGATNDEVNSVCTGDSEVSMPVVSSTRAITIGATPQQIWPWLVQIGHRRAGWYAYDQFDNDGISSATRIIPELQHLQIGDVVGEEGFTVRTIDPNKSLVLAFHYPKVSWVFKEGIWPKFGHCSLAYILNPISDNQTRLMMRMHFQFRLLSLPTLYWPLFELADFFSERKQLMSIKQRVEKAAAA